jgi:hypothetical protein
LQDEGKAKTEQQTPQLRPEQVKPEKDRLTTGTKING